MFLRAGVRSESCGGRLVVDLAASFELSAFVFDVGQASKREVKQLRLSAVRAF